MKIKRQFNIIHTLVTVCLLLTALNCDDGVKGVMTEEKQAARSKTSGDIAAPVPGDSGTLIPFNIGSTAIRLRWTRAVDETIPEEELHYKIYLSLCPDIATYSDMTTYGEPYIDGWTENIRNVWIRGLDPSTTYYINVAVTDRAGNVAAYTMETFTTDP